MTPPETCEASHPSPCIPCETDAGKDLLSGFDHVQKLHQHVRDLHKREEALRAALQSYLTMSDSVIVELRDPERAKRVGREGQTFDEGDLNGRMWAADQVRRALAEAEVKT